MTVEESKDFAFEVAPTRLAEDCLNEFRSSGRFPRSSLERLVELSLSDDVETAKVASRAFFASLIEPLCDSFDADSVSFYNRAFSFLIERARKKPRGAKLDLELKKFNLTDETGLIARAEALRPAHSLKRFHQSKRTVKRIIVLSRVTLGADVAITSVIIERMKIEFPDARIVLLGGRKAAELFGGDPRLSFKEVHYSRSANAIEKLLSWPEVVASVNEASERLSRGEYIIIDPDSRLTQLGLLPLTQPDKEIDDYLFFPSREYDGSTRLSLAELSSQWLDEVFGRPSPTLPCVTIARDDVERGGRLVNKMRGSERPVVTINFGVGGNPKKRVGDDFESALVCRLLEAGATVILDKGAGDEESKRANAIIKSAQAIAGEGRAIKITQADEGNLEAVIKSPDLHVDMLVWNGRIGLLAAMIGESDLYIGYDSAGQHIAAAMSVPCIDIFAGYSSKRMLDRWRPAGKSESRVIAVDSTSVIDERAVLSDVLQQASQLLNRKSKE